MNKYYIPTKDEFFDGFKFETKVEDRFVESLYSTSWSEDDPTNFRVKYLNIQDLKSLGFNVIDETYLGTMLEKNVTSAKPTFYRLFFTEENGLPFIQMTDTYNNILLGKIHIKNINELQWLLNKYGVL